MAGLTSLESGSRAAMPMMSSSGMRRRRHRSRFWGRGPMKMSMEMILTVYLMSMKVRESEHARHREYLEKVLVLLKRFRSRQWIYLMLSTR